MMEELSRAKLEAEIRKLDAETNAIAHPFAKPANWIPLFLALGGILSAIFQWQSSNLERQQASLKLDRAVFELTKELSQKKADLQNTDTNLISKRNELAEAQAQQSKLEEANKELVIRQKVMGKTLAEIDDQIKKKTELFVKLEKGQITQREVIAKSKKIDESIAADVSQILQELDLTPRKLAVIRQIVNNAKNQGILLPAQIAYILATTHWETNGTMLPYKEAFRENEDWRKRNLPYYPYYGRGYVGLTWKYNYQKMSQLLAVDLINDPELAMDPDIASSVLIIGLRDGLFTGRKLSDYINEEKVDYTEARRIINGLDNAENIAQIALKFQHLLESVEFSKNQQQP